MTSQEFCYWLQGFFELGNPESLTEQQVQVINNHLDMVNVLASTQPPFGQRRSTDNGSVLIKC